MFSHSKKEPRRLKSAMRKATIICGIILMVVVATGATEDEERAIEAIERASLQYILQQKYVTTTNSKFILENGVLQVHTIFYRR